MQRVGMLTSGGDCPGLNAAVVGLVEQLERSGATPVLVRRGFQGLLDAAEGKDCVLALERLDRRRDPRLGGTVLGSARVKLKGDTLDRALQGVAQLGLDQLVVIGGDGSLHSARRLGTHLPVVALPKTIDNDVAATELSIGFQSAVQTAVESLERIQDTAASHGTCFVVEVMGRRSGFLAAASALAARADVVVVPEYAWTLDALAARVRHGAVIVVAEGAWCDELADGPLRDRDGRLGGIAAQLVEELRARVPSVLLRATALGHTLRGGPPVATDRLFAQQLAATAITLVKGQGSGLCAMRDGQVVALGLDATEQGRRLLSRADRERIGHLLP